MSEKSVAELQAELQDMQAAVDSLTEQLHSFYNQQEQHGGWSIDDYALACESLNEQVCSYVEQINH